MGYNTNNYNKQGGKEKVINGEVSIAGSVYHGDKDNNNYSTFENDGTLVFLGDAIVWKDINIGGASLTRQPNKQPDLIDIDNTDVKTYAFDGTSSEEELHGGFELQHDYKEGTAIRPHGHFYPTTADAGDFKIFLDYWIILDKVISGTTSSIVSTNETAWEQLAFEFDDEIQDNDLGIGAQIHFKIYRDPSDNEDTYGADVAIGTVGIHYEIDTIGSRGVFQK